MSVENLSFDLNAIVNRGNKKTYAKSETIKPGVSSYRILPSAVASTRQISKFWAVHWLLGPNGKKLQTECTQYKEKFCPVCNAHKEVEEEQKRAKETGDKALQDRLKESEEALRAARHVYYNALNASNEIVILKLSSTVSKQVETLLQDSVTKKGFDPISPTTGVWFEFTKQGFGRDSVRVDYRRDPKTDQRDHTPVADETMNLYKSSATNIYTAEGLNIKQFTAKQLSDYLRGIPLPMENAASSTTESSDDSDDTSEAPSTPQSVATATETQAPAAAAPKAQSAEGGTVRKAELDRLRALMGGNKS
jgi:hypothetical protein